jgi:hypothetical protein
LRLGLGLGAGAPLKTSYRKNCPAMIAPDHKQREPSPRKNPSSPNCRYTPGTRRGVRVRVRVEG